VYNRGLEVANQPFQPYTGERFAGFTPDQIASFEAARNAAGAGAGAIQSGIDATTGLAQFQNPFEFAQAYTGPNAANVSAQQLGPGGGVNGVTPYVPGSISAERITAERGPGDTAAYTNPYEQAVVDASLSDIERARREASAATRSQAAAAGAFGGSRSGVAESLTNRDFARQAALTAAQLRQGGYDRATSLTEADKNRALEAARANQTASLGAAQSSLGAQTQAGIAGGQLGLSNAELVQRGLLANQSTDLQAQLANQSAGLNAGQFNAGQLQQSGQFNASNNALGALNAGQLRLGAAGQLGQLGQAQQGQAATGAGLLNQIGGQQQALNQAGADFNFDEFVRKNNLSRENVDLLSRLLAQGQYGSTTNSTTSTAESKPNPNRGSFLGTLGGIGGTLLGGPIGGAIANRLFPVSQNG